MYVLRLQKEWEQVTRHQYDCDLDGSLTVKIEIDADQCVKLLTRCLKMYDAKSMIQKLLKMTSERENSADSKVKRKLNLRIQQQIQALQNEHKIFKRPFILYGHDYYETVKLELVGCFVDESQSTQIYWF